MRRRLVRALLVPVVLPHELGHALPALAAGIRPEISVLPEWAGDAVPLGRFNGAIPETTPAWAIRVIALAPLPLFLGVAAIVRPIVPTEPLLALPAVVLLSVWATLSPGDLAIASNPRAARAAGEFLVRDGRWRLAPFVSTPLTTAAVAGILLA
jgi:hypothetical protein